VHCYLIPTRLRLTDSLFHSYGSKVNAAQENILQSKSNGILLALIRSLLRILGVGMGGRVGGGMARCKIDDNWRQLLRVRVWITSRIGALMRGLLFVYEAKGFCGVIVSSNGLSRIKSSSC
jgi:hypothetical protein